jgi:hypothetical protein
MKRHALAFIAVVLALFGAQSARAEAARPDRGDADVFAKSPSPVHGIAADHAVVFVTRPSIEPGAASSVVALDARTGRRIGQLPPPPGGFRFPFALRIAGKGRLAVLDNAGFPPQGAPKIHEYRYTTRRRISATRERTIDFAGLPLLFAEDLELMPKGGYVVSESVVGALWLVGRNGKIRPGLVPTGPAPLPKLGGCAHPTGLLTVGDLPFSSNGGFAPGVGSLAISGDDLFFGTSCLGGLHRLDLDTLTDTDRPAIDRAATIETVSPRPARTRFESLKGLAVDKANRRHKWIYAGDAFRLRLIRIHPRTGERQIVADDSRLFNFPVAATFRPRAKARGRARLLVTSDQEYRWAGLNGALTQNAFKPPFLVTQFTPGVTSRTPRP